MKEIQIPQENRRNAVGEVVEKKDITLLTEDYSVNMKNGKMLDENWKELYEELELREKELKEKDEDLEESLIAQKEDLKRLRFNNIENNKHLLSPSFNLISYSDNKVIETTSNCLYDKKSDSLSFKVDNFLFKTGYIVLLAEFDYDAIINEMELESITSSMIINFGGFWSASWSFTATGARVITQNNEGKISSLYRAMHKGKGQNIIGSMFNSNSKSLLNKVYGDSFFPTATDFDINNTFYKPDTFEIGGLFQKHMKSITIYEFDTEKELLFFFK